jgi:hypothetical protein
MRGATAETTPVQVDESLDELSALVMAAGAEVAARVVQDRPAPTPAFISWGRKIEEIGALAGGGPPLHLRRCFRRCRRNISGRRGSSRRP